MNQAQPTLPLVRLSAATPSLSFTVAFIVFLFQQDIATESNPGTMDPDLVDVFDYLKPLTYWLRFASIPIVSAHLKRETHSTLWFTGTNPCGSLRFSIKGVYNLSEFVRTNS